jgi:hypothetical protein
VNLTADGGAGGYMYHVMRKDQAGTFNIPGFDDPRIVGVVFRYYLYRVLSRSPELPRLRESKAKPSDTAVRCHDRAAVRR